VNGRERLLVQLYRAGLQAAEGQPRPRSWTSVTPAELAGGLILTNGTARAALAQWKSYLTRVHLPDVAAMNYALEVTSHLEKATTADEKDMTS
jgi:hypothetical protein